MAGAQVGGHVVVIGTLTTPSPEANTIPEAVEAGMLQRVPVLRQTLQVSDRTTANPLEGALDAEIDGYRDLIRDGQPKTALKLLHKRLQNIPAGASDKIVFRIKANIGHCHLQLGEDEEAKRWLLEAYDAAPQEPKAIANKALALLLGHQAEEAYRFCRDALVADANNEYAAAHLLQAAASIAVDDPLPLIPAGLREREEVVVSRIFFLRTREVRPDWWELARQKAKLFPANDRIAFFAAEAAIDEATRDPSFQTMRRVDKKRRRLLLDAAEVFDAQWAKVLNGEASDRINREILLSHAMLARQIRGDFELALEKAGELIDRTSDSDLLLNTVQVALFSHRYDLADRGLANLEDSPKSNFFRAMLHVERNQWQDAVDRFAAADIPEVEKPLAATIAALAPLYKAGATPDEGAFGPALKAASEDARCLIVVARSARAFGLGAISGKAFSAATALLDNDSTLAERSMVAAYAASNGDAGGAIRVLDGYAQEDELNEELIRLSQAHASEQPPRRRNLDFFERLPSRVRERPEIARPYASVLLQSGQYPQAADAFIALAKDRPDDVYAQLGRADALRRAGRHAEVPSAVLAVDENALQGPPEHRMQFAHELRNAGAPDRALRYAYGLVREIPDNPQVAMGYAFLILGDREKSIVPDAPKVGKDAWVRIASSAGETDAFTIDDGASFFGIEVRAPDHPSAKRIQGLKSGSTFEVDRGPIPAETWKVAEVKSKYLHLFHVIMGDLGRKFPDFKGMWRMSVKEGDISEILDVIRKLSEANQQRAKQYTDAQLPLSFVAKMMGGDAPSFAQYVRGLGANIITCTGIEQEFAAACTKAEEARGKGAVLDFYTAWVAAEMGILDILKAWFGRLITPQSTIEAIDRLMAREEEGRGQRMMTVGWHNGQFLKQEITDDFIDQQVKALRTIRESILAHCEIARAILPNDLSELALKILDLIDAHTLDPVYTARSENMLLLSDDLRYRQVANVVAEVPGIWLQTVLTAAHAAGAVNRDRTLQAYVGLAARRHDHLRLDAGILLDIYKLSEDDELRNFEVITEFIGSQNADMRSHTLVVYHFLSALWRAAKGDPKSQKATSMIISKLLRFRSADWHVWLGLLSLGTSIEIDEYVERWLRGHFLPTGPMVDAVRAWRVKLRRRRFGPVSALALLVAGAI